MTDVFSSLNSLIWVLIVILIIAAVVLVVPSGGGPACRRARLDFADSTS